MKAPYRSTIRREQRQQTRERILAAAVATLASGVAELSIAAVARRAKVSVPTVYRHFPSKRALIAGVAAHVERQTGVADLPLPRDAEELAESASELFRRLEALEPATRAAMASRLGARVRRDAMMGRRRALVAAALAKAARGPELELLVDVVLVLWSSAALQAFKDYLGLDAAAAAERVSWAIRALAGGRR